MPPEGEPLSGQQIETLHRWIADGASWPSDFVPVRAETPHWSFQSVIRPEVPEIQGKDVASANPIDAFVAAKLADRGLKMAPPSDPRKLIRRVSLDLTGLPPSPEEVNQFLAATSGASDQEVRLAWEKVIDRLLASPR